MSRAISRVMRSSGERCMSGNVARTFSSENTLRNVDCSSATASATFRAPSNTGSFVVLTKSDRIIVSRSVSAGVRVRKRDAKTATAATTSASAAAASHGRNVVLPAALAAGASNASAIAAADRGRSRGSRANACITTRSSRGSTSAISVDGRGGGPAGRVLSGNGRWPVTSS
jgi:hypothetical protein